MRQIERNREGSPSRLVEKEGEGHQYPIYPKGRNKRTRKKFSMSSSSGIRREKECFSIHSRKEKKPPFPSVCPEKIKGRGEKGRRVDPPWIESEREKEVIYQINTDKHKE